LRNISRPLVLLLLPALLLVPRVDAIFSATMPRKALVEPLLLVLLGWALSRAFPRRTAWYAPSAVAAATLLFLFSMIPRSIDLTQIYPAANALYVVGLFAGGFLLSHYLPVLSGVAKSAYALCFSSMIVAVGLLYASQSTLLCSAFTLADQHAFGWLVVPVGLAAYLAVLASMPNWLIPSSGRERG
jgi:hypothetical protein